MDSLTRGALHLAIQITGSHDDAMDVLQNAVIKAMEHRNAPKPSEKGYKAWLYRVVRNQAIDFLRSQKKFDRDHDLETVSSPVNDPEKENIREQRKVFLHQALNKLSAEQREIICLKDFHHFSYAEIAEIMQIEKGTVMSRLHRARTALKDRLVKMNFFQEESNEM